MTGREQRVMTGYSAISGQQRPGEEGDVTAPLAKLQEKRKAVFNKETDGSMNHKNK